MSDKRARKNAKRLRRRARKNEKKRTLRTRIVTSKSDEIDQVELTRYIEYLQKKLLTDGTESFFDPNMVKDWTKKNRKVLIERAKIYSPNDAEEMADSMTDMIASFQPKTRFDTPFNRHIFEPLLEGIAREAAEIDLAPERPVTVENSTDLSVTPYSRPSADHHLIFIGVSTATFCSLWAKVYTHLFVDLAASGITEHSTDADYRAAVRKNVFSILHAGRLCAYYGFFSNLLQFENFQEPNASSVAGLRLEILASMESFVLAHEYAHCKCAEDFSELQNANDSESKKKLEYICDLMAMRLSRGASDKNQNTVGVMGAGAFLFFNSVKLSDKVTELLGRAKPDNDDHPELEERMRFLHEWTIENTAPEKQEAVASYLKSLFLVCDELNTIIVEIFTSYAQEQSKTESQ